MAKREEISKITIENVSASKNGQIDPKTLVTLDADIKALVNAVKSAINSGAFKGVVDKRIDPSTGKASVDVFVTKGELANALSAIAYQKGLLKTKAKYTASSEDAQMLKGTIQLHGASARTKALEEIDTAGGFIVHRPTKARPDNYDWYAPADKSVVDKKAFRDSIFQETIKLSASNLKTKEDIQREKNEERQKKEEAREEKESKRFVKGAITKVIAVLGVITDITRRILTSVMTGASQAVRDTREAGDYGLSYKDVRSYKLQEKALGIKEGSIFGAIQDIQEKFGNITSLDEKSIEQLAVVMGGEVKELIQSGIGGSNPDVLMNTILDKYFATAMSGYNSIGQYVGQEQARRELISQLSRVSPQLSELLSVMLENAQNQNSLYYGKFNSFEGLQGLIQTNRNNFTDTDYAILNAFGQNVNNLSAIWASMKEGIMIKLSDKLYNVLQGVKNTRIGMSDEQSHETDLKNAEQRAKDKAMLQERLATINEETLGKALLNKEGFDAQGIKTENLTMSMLASVYAGNALTDEQYISLGANLNKRGKLTAKEKARINQILMGWYMQVQGSPEYFEASVTEAGMQWFLNEILESEKDLTRVDAIDITPALIKRRGEQAIISAIADEYNYFDLPEGVKARVRDYVHIFFRGEFGQAQKASVDKLYNPSFTDIDYYIPQYTTGELPKFNDLQKLKKDIVKANPNLKDSLALTDVQGILYYAHKNNMLPDEYKGLIDFDRLEEDYLLSRYWAGQSEITKQFRGSWLESWKHEVEDDIKTLTGNVTVSVEAKEGTSATTKGNGDIIQTDANTWTMDFAQSN